jgi:hypothetical protein
MSLATSAKPAASNPAMKPNIAQAMAIMVQIVIMSPAPDFPSAPSRRSSPALGVAPAPVLELTRIFRQPEQPGYEGNRAISMVAQD